MTNITNIDSGQAGWDGVINTNFKNLNNMVIGGRNYFSLEKFKRSQYREDYLEMPSVNLQLAANTTYTVSTNIPARDDQGTQDLFAGNAGFKAVSGTNGVKAGSPLTVTTNNTGILQISVRNVSLNTGQYHVQVELGDKATDWCPAVEDTAQVTDTGWIRDGITLMNGAKVYSNFLGDTPAFRIIQLGAVDMLMLSGSVNGIAITKGWNLTLNVATLPQLVTDWFSEHQMVNTHFDTRAFGVQYGWNFYNGKIQLQYCSETSDDTFWINFNHVFIS
ncbi:hypothetical protein LPPLD21_01244 [Lactiplantibacillus paraplantarum]|uniref:Uncharacterized protein n=1 Tax=Lactiplantibacillus paraplantarum TaxID=60520 RepID=A0ABQ0NBC1_9LACO|nr:hypothetical protein [Lactiplantibacillus paraplantarum]GBF01712.1 hypothetical protein LPPLD21_01244 [Lactiplantibacillus paraplantarum]